MTLELIRVAGLDASDASELRRAAARDDLHRIRNGTFVDAAVWARVGDRMKHRALVVAAMASRRSNSLVVADRSAAALHGLPWIGGYGDTVTLLDRNRDRGHIAHGVRRIGARGRDVGSSIIEGIPVTDLRSTAVDIALRHHPIRAIVVLDDVLRRGIERESLLDELVGRGDRRARKAEHLIALADGSAESPGESVTRWAADVLGAPRPETQREFTDALGLIGRVDLWFPDQRFVLEFDGHAKYSDETIRNGRSAADVVIDEKRREDRLRAHGDIDGVGRTEWREVMPGGRFPWLLLEHAIPLHPQWKSRWLMESRRWAAR